jgi:hypothetical protein
MKATLSFLAGLMLNFTYGQFKFPNLNYVQISTSQMDGSFGYDASLDFVVINKPCSTLKDCYKYDDPTVLLGLFTLEDGSIVEFHYTEAPSDDPTFLAVHQGSIILEEAGTRLHFKGKTLYVEGIANTYFDMKRKFQFINTHYKEVKQPFYAINAKGTLNYSIDLYTDETFTEKVASLPKGYPIEIVLGKTGGKYNELEVILIKSEFGLLGWFDFKKISFGSPLIEGFYFHGD